MKIPSFLPHKYHHLGQRTRTEIKELALHMAKSLFVPILHVFSQEGPLRQNQEQPWSTNRCGLQTQNKSHYPDVNMDLSIECEWIHFPYSGKCAAACFCKVEFRGFPKLLWFRGFLISKKSPLLWLVFVEEGIFSESFVPTEVSPLRKFCLLRSDWYYWVLVGLGSCKSSLI